MQSKSLSKNIKRITLWRVVQMKFLHEIYRLSIFSEGKESKKVFFTAFFFGTKMVHNNYRM